MKKDNLITNEAEAWAVLAELIAGAEALPGGVLSPTSAAGLCGAAAVGFSCGVFSRATWNAMYARIRRALRPGRGWLCPPFAWRPRVVWCRRFARQAARDGV